MHNFSPRLVQIAKRVRSVRLETKRFGRSGVRVRDLIGQKLESHTKRVRVERSGIYSSRTPHNISGFAHD